MASIISDYNDGRQFKSYGKAALFGNNIRSTRIPYFLIAKGNRLAGIEAKE